MPQYRSRSEGVTFTIADATGDTQIHDLGEGGILTAATIDLGPTGPPLRVVLWVRIADKEHFLVGGWIRGGGSAGPSGAWMLNWNGRLVIPPRAEIVLQVRNDTGAQQTLGFNWLIES